MKSIPIRRGASTGTTPRVGATAGTAPGRGAPGRPGILVPALLMLLSACGGRDGSGESPPGERRVDSPLNTVVLGSRGDPILAIHGGPGMDHNYLASGLAPLAEDRRLVLYDQRGTGASDLPVDSASVSFDVFVDDVDGVRAAQGIERINVLGHSFGGLLAIAYALRHPDRVRSLILVGTVEPGQRYLARVQENQRSRRTAADSAELAELVRSEAFRLRDPGAVNRVYEVSFRSTFADPARADQLLELGLTAVSARNGSAVAALVGGSLGSYDWWDRLSSIDVPTLVVHGARDPIPLDMARELADSIPDARLVVVDGAGHFPFLEAPEETFDAIRAFLSGLDR